MWIGTRRTSPRPAALATRARSLPRELEGIPEEERRYINHTYSLILKATHEKLLALKALEEQQNIDEAQKRYESQVKEVVKKLQYEETPPGLEAFEGDVLEALSLQAEFFRRAAGLRASGSDMTEVFRIPAGRKASSHLQAAWRAMAHRYPAWKKATSESVYHHLCALDLF